MREICPNCGLNLLSREADTWAFMYFSTGLITGIFILLMFLIFPTRMWLARIIIGILALLVFILTEPTRKGLAIAWDYLVELRWNNVSGLRFRPRPKGP